MTHNICADSALPAWHSHKHLSPDRIATVPIGKSHTVVPQNGLLTMLGALVGGLGLPVFATHTWAAWRYMSSPSKSLSKCITFSRDTCAQAACSTRILDTMQPSVVSTVVSTAAAVVCSTLHWVSRIEAMTYQSYKVSTSNDYTICATTAPDTDGRILMYRWSN